MVVLVGLPICTLAMRNKQIPCLNTPRSSSPSFFTSCPSSRVFIVHDVEVSVYSASWSIIKESVFRIAKMGIGNPKKAIDVCANVNDPFF